MSPDPLRRLFAEAAGTTALVIAVVGSGIMANGLAGELPALALLANAVATSAALVVTILALGPVSGAHLNPAVSLAEAARGALAGSDAAGRSLVQLIGALAGVVMAHAMFGLPLVRFSTHVRSGPGQWLSEGVAAFGLVATVRLCGRAKASAVPAAIGLYILGAYWFTASTAFANPAVTVARALTDTFTGIRPIDVPAFVVAQLAGALAAGVVCSWLLEDGGSASSVKEQQ